VPLQDVAMKCHGPAMFFSTQNKCDDIADGAFLATVVCPFPSLPLILMHSGWAIDRPGLGTHSSSAVCLLTPLLPHPHWQIAARARPAENTRTT
jgi:hypothetical protein